MLSSALLSFREGFEAVLIVGIIHTYLKQTNKKNLSKYVFWGGVIGILISLVGGFIGFREAQQMEEAGEAIFEGTMMLLAAGLIGYFVVWMARQNRNIAANLKSSVDHNSTGWGLFTLTFLSVFREGLELVTFILTKVNEQASIVAVGTLLGIIVAITLGYVLFKTSTKLNVKMIFKVLGLILIFIGAELLGEGLVKFIPAGGEALEVTGAILFAGFSLLYFLKDDLNRVLKRA
ncbi:FTR1 family protein [Tepidibacillus marianensis]|uniref:FTR1 family iron permease n=1 Tax=Tepidibacillus marianensis TaxID=3131995 RepID=UPI0030D4DA1F